jgi:hypothetical protein
LRERTLCILPLLAEYGLALLDDLLAASPAPGSSQNAQCARQHHLIVLQ